MRHKRFIAVIFPVVLLILPAAAQKNAPSSPELQQFEIGRHTFFDFGPPFDYYEVLAVRSNGSGSAIQRLILSPSGDDACRVPGSIDSASASLSESAPALLGNTNPCAIPEKELHRELKRCKHCMVFSGANITMRVPCGARLRLIRSDILDRDLFSSTPNTPEHTSWTMQLLDRLDQALGPGVMEKPAFSAPLGDPGSHTNLDAETRRKLESGAYDELFPKAREKLSSIYRVAQISVPPPSVQLLSSLPFTPQDPVLPIYPPLAKAARIQGIVSFTVTLGAEGSPGLVIFTQGHKLLLEAVRESVGTWKFPKEAASQMISGSIQFSLNCPPSAR